MSLNPHVLPELTVIIANKVVLGDVQRALDSYLGDITWGHVGVHPGTPVDILRTCFHYLVNEGTADEFIGRIVHRIWCESDVRRTILAPVPHLARLEGRHDLDVPLALVVAGLQRVMAGLNDDATVDLALEQRDPLGQITVMTDNLEASKAVFDSLHRLEILAVTWDDAAEDGDIPLDDLSEGILAEIAAIRDLRRRLPAQVLAPADRILADLEEMLSWLIPDRNSTIPAGDPQELAAFATEMLRAMLAETLPAINLVIIELSRDLPIRALHRTLSAYPGGDWPRGLREAAMGLRRKVFAQGLWQDVSDRLNAIEQTLAFPDTQFFVRSADHWQMARGMLRILIHGREDPLAPLATAVTDALEATALLREEGTDPARTATARQRLEEAFRNFIWGVRLRFRAVDASLLAACRAFLALTPVIEELSLRLARHDGARW